MNDSASAICITTRRPIRTARSLPSLIALRIVVFPSAYIFDIPFMLTALSGGASDFTICVNFHVLSRYSAIVYGGSKVRRAHTFCPPDELTRIRRGTIQGGEIPTPTNSHKFVG